MVEEIVMQELAEQIHEASLALLWDPGVKIEHEEIRQVLLSAGCSAGAASEVLKFPRTLVEEMLALCPKEVWLAARNNEGRRITATCRPCIWSVPGLYLHRRGEHRPYTSEDLAQMTRLLHHLEQVDGVFGYSLDDIEPRARDVVGLRIMAENTTKHIRVFCFTPEGADLLTEMKEVIGKIPWFSIGFTAHGPLRWTGLALEIFKRTAGCGIPASINGEPMAGVSGPVSLAGSAAVGNAEILSGIVINQLLEPGRPLTYNLGLAHIFDMRTAIAVTGGPENALFAKYSALMGRHYKLPSASWVSTESMAPDSQAALEKMAGFLTHLGSGVSNIWGVGQLESQMTFSPAQAVIDNEMIGYVKRYLRGLEVNANTLVVDEIRKTGIAGCFLETEHTAEYYRSEFFMPSILFREQREAWVAQGTRRLDERADEAADALIDRAVESGLREDQLRELDALVARFLKAAS